MSTTMSLRVVYSRLVFGEVTSPNTRTFKAYDCKLIGRVLSLYGEDKRVTPHTSLRSVLRQQAVIAGRGAQHFFKSQSMYRGRAQNFSKSQSLGGGSGMELPEFFQVPEPRRKLGRGILPSPKAHIKGENSEFSQVPPMGVPNPIYRHISSYFHIFSTYSCMFPSYLLHQGIPECDVVKGRGVLANPEITP